jgi:hypothetical protein
MSTQTPTHAERLVEIRERLEALTGVSAFSAVGNCYREDIPYLLERLTFAEDAVTAWQAFSRHLSECERCEMGHSECLRRDVLWEKAQRLTTAAQERH